MLDKNGFSAEKIGKIFDGKGVSAFRQSFPGEKKIIFFWQVSCGNESENCRWKLYSIYIYIYIYLSLDSWINGYPQKMRLQRRPKSYQTKGL